MVALLVWTWRGGRPGHPARTGAALAMLFMLTEAGVGAGLVLFQLVADNASFARAMFLSVHLINTFTLLAFLALTAWWLSGGAPLASAAEPAARRPWPACAPPCWSWPRAVRSPRWATRFPGVVAEQRALGRPVGDLARPIRLRILHPVLAAVTAVAVVLGARRIAAGSAPRRSGSLPPSRH